MVADGRLIAINHAAEQDTDKLIALVREINDLLEEKEQRLKRERAVDPYTRGGAEC